MLRVHIKDSLKRVGVARHQCLERVQVVVVNDQVVVKGSFAAFQRKGPSLTRGQAFSWRPAQASVKGLSGGERRRVVCL